MEALFVFKGQVSPVHERHWKKKNCQMILDATSDAHLNGF